MRADQFAETLRSWRGLYKLPYSRPMRADYHCESKKPGEHWSFDPEICLQLLPIMTAKWRLSGMHSMLSTPWRIV
jgi:hypothetical protein